MKLCFCSVFSDDFIEIKYLACQKYNEKLQPLPPFGNYTLNLTKS